MLNRVFSVIHTFKPKFQQFDLFDRKFVWKNQLFYSQNFDLKKFYTSLCFLLVKNCFSVSKIISLDRFFLFIKKMMKKTDFVWQFRALNIAKINFEF